MTDAGMALCSRDLELHRPGRGRGARGAGPVEVDGREEKVAAGWCYHLPERTPHLVLNESDEYLVERGVFTPAGSPGQNTPVD